MKKLLCVVPALVLFAMIGSPAARADSYTPTLTCIPGLSSSDFVCNLMPSSYTAPDVSFPSPTVQVTVQTVLGFKTYDDVYDVTLPASDSPTDTYRYAFSLGIGPQGDSLVYGYLSISDETNRTDGFTSDLIGTGSDPGHSIQSGTVTFTPVSAATPEPASLILMALGAGLIFFIRKRFTMRVPHTV